MVRAPMPPRLVAAMVRFSGMRPVIVERSVDCASSAPALWRLVSDTERINRAIGMGPVTFVPNADATAARFLARTVTAGFAIEYEERPFEWAENRHFSIRRVLRKGLVRVIENTFVLTPLPEKGTRVTVRISVEPRYAIMRPVVVFQTRRFVGRVIREFRNVDASLERGARPRFSTVAPVVSADGLGRAATALRAAAGNAGRSLVDKLLAHVTDAPDLEVDRMRPYELADTWGEDRRASLAVFLAAVNTGLLALRWDIVCPSCRTATDGMSALSQIGDHGHCPMCDIDYALELDRSIEATFSPARGVRAVDVGPYCSGGPARTPHVVAQAILPAAGMAQLRAPESAGRYRLFVRGGAGAALTVGVGGEEVEARLIDRALAPARLEVAAGGTVRVHNPDARELHAKIERLDWAERAATAYDVSTLPEFRARFASDVLRPGLALQVGRTALLFTDLTDSTALYSNIGDARAFRLVQDHFDLLRGVIEENRGAIVKTIGDAIMASFAADADAVRAAVAMHRAFPAFRTRHGEAPRTRLKIGVYAGPCYAVTANGTLDYFGQSVNVAARLQGAAHAGEIVMTEELAERAGQGGWLGTARVSEKFSAELKGLDAPVAAARVPVDRPDPARVPVDRPDPG